MSRPLPTAEATHFLVSFKPVHHNIISDISEALQHLVDDTRRTETGAFLAVHELPKCFKPDLTRLPTLSKYAPGEIVSSDKERVG